MEALNNRHLSSTTTKTEAIGSQELQERLLAQLNVPLENRTRPRNPLSKFTITSPSCHSPSCQNPIPAYRTFAQESLPILSPEDKNKLNISPVTGMPYYISSSTAHQSSWSCVTTDALKTRRCILQRKTIHRSLEDLRSSSAGKRNHPSDDLISPRARKSNPFCSGNSSVPRHVFNKECNKLKKNENQKPLQACPESSLRQAKKLNSHVQTDNIISTNTITAIATTTHGEEFRNIVCDNGGCGGPDGDFHVSSSSDGSSPVNNKTNEDEAEEGWLRNLSIENELLKQRIKEERRKRIFYKIVNAFAFEALRKRSKQLDRAEQSLLQRREECAARIILHHLLLNSWKMTKCQVNAVRLENAQMHKTIGNQSLKLNVIRKMQSIEKDKNISVLKEYTEIKRNYCQTIKENECMKGVNKQEFAKVLEERRSLERHLMSLSDENSRLSTDLQIRLDKKEMQLRSMDLDRLCAEKFLRENEQLEKESELARMQIKELTTQQAHWQEKAVGYESKCYELKLEMECREKAHEKVLYEKTAVSKENEILAMSKSKLEKAVEETQAKLVECTEQKEQLKESYNKCREELEDLEDRVEYLQSALRHYKKENTEIKQKLYDRNTQMLKNVKRRRVWGAALYFLVNPIEAFKRLYFGIPEEMQPSRVVISAKRKPEKNPDEIIGES